MLVPVVLIVGQDPFDSFDPVVKNKLQFIGPNLIRKLDERLKRLINIIQ
jgi:hypothetical protein